MSVGLIIEGRYDATSVAALVRNTCVIFNLQSFPAPGPFRAGELKKIKRAGQLETIAEHVCRRPECSSALIVLDADEHCPVEENTNLRPRIEALDWLNKPIGFCLINSEYETFFLHQIERIAERWPEREWANIERFQEMDIENVRGAKEALRHCMRKLKYKPSRDQERFSAVLNLEELYEQSRSYRHLVDEIRGLGNN